MAGGRERIRVAVLIGALDVGGSERDLARLLPLVDQARFEITVFEFNHAGALGVELASHGVSVVSRRTAEEAEADTGAGGLARAFERLRVFLWVMRRLGEFAPDVTHSVLPHSYLYQMTAGALARPRAGTVMSRRSLNFYRDSQRFLSWMERHVLHRRVDAAIGNAQAVVDELIAEGVPASRAHLVHNGIDVSDYAVGPSERSAFRLAHGIADDAFVIAALGNLHPYKGHADLIDAAARVAERLPSGWLIAIAGGGTDEARSALEGQAAERGVARHVRILGRIERVPEFLAAADLVCHPSHHEGLPNAVIEAMAAGLPVIGTDVGGIPELVVTQGAAATGWLVAPCDPDALGACLADAAADPARLHTMGDAARMRIETEFSASRAAVAHEAIYTKLAVAR